MRLRASQPPSTSYRRSNLPFWGKSLPAQISMPALSARVTLAGRRRPRQLSGARPYPPSWPTHPPTVRKDNNGRVLFSFAPRRSYSTPWLSSPLISLATLRREGISFHSRSLHSAYAAPLFDRGSPRLDDALTILHLLLHHLLTGQWPVALISVDSLCLRLWLPDPTSATLNDAAYLFLSFEPTIPRLLHKACPCNLCPHPSHHHLHQYLYPQRCREL